MKATRSSVLIILVLIGLVVLVTGVLQAAATGWAGVRSQRALAPGERVSLSSGLKVTIPDGWSGEFIRYWPVPLWIPVGDAADLARREEIIASGVLLGESTEIRVLSLRRGGQAAERVLSRLPVDGRVSRGTPFVGLLPSSTYQDMRVVTVVVDRGTKSDIALVTLSSSAAIEPDPVARLAWEVLSIEGAELPSDE